MKNVVALSASLLLVLLLSPGPALAQVSPPTVVDRTAITLTYLPTGPAPAAAITGFAVSWRFDRTWDFLLSYSSAGAANATRYGVRYHLRAPGPAFDPYLTLQAASQTAIAPAGSPFLVGAGVAYDVAPTVTTYTALTYHSLTQVIYYDIGVQYQINRQFSFVGGVNSGVGAAGAAGYLGLSFNLATR